MKVIALNLTPDHKDIVGVATPHPSEDPDANRLTLRTSQDAADADATWLLTQFLESVALGLTRFRGHRSEGMISPERPAAGIHLLYDARPVLLNLGAPGGLDIAPWSDRVRLIHAEYAGEWELPVFGSVTAPTAVLIRPDGYVAWVGERTHLGLTDALITWFRSPTAAQRTGLPGSIVRTSKSG